MYDFFKSHQLKYFSVIRNLLYIDNMCCLTCVLYFRSFDVQWVAAEVVIIAGKEKNTTTLRADSVLETFCY